MAWNNPNRRLGCVTVCLLSALGACGQTQPTQYPYGPDSERHPGVPEGTVQKFRFTSPHIFEGTERDGAVYIPAQYDGKEPACVMVFQDGIGYLGDKGAWRIPIVFDNLINQKLMPITVGVFLNPGELPCPTADNPHAKRINRSFEYDTPDDRYVRFLLEEALPYVEKTYNLNLTRDGNSRAICGSSSGGICAFNAAWQRPNEFRRVISTIGSFTQLHGGGNNIPAMIRQTEPLPIRVFLEDGDKDLDNFAGDWPLANREMGAALHFQGYDYQLVFHEGGHSGSHGGPFLPDMLKFIWKDYPKPIPLPQPDMTKPHGLVMDVIEPGEGWKPVTEKYTTIDCLCADGAGNVCFGAVGNILKIEAGSGKVVTFAQDLWSPIQMGFGPDGVLYALTYANGQPETKLLAVTPGAPPKTIIDKELYASGLCIRRDGSIYLGEPGLGRMTYLSPDRRTTQQFNGPDGGFKGMIFDVPEGQLITRNFFYPFIGISRIEADGSLGHFEPFYSDYADRPIYPLPGISHGPSGLAMDREGRLYAASGMGIQIFSTQGGVIGILRNPTYELGQPCTGITFGGAKFDTLYAVCGDKIYARRLRATGANTLQPPAPATNPH
jgi:gluconolactonase